METTAAEVKVREALSAIGQYFADTIPPLHAAESLGVLLHQPAQLMASEIITWVSSQYRTKEENAAVADYLFHAVCKLQYLAHLQLISEQQLAPYLGSVKPLLLEYCPAEDRPALAENFNHIVIAETATEVPINYIYRQRNYGESEPGLWDRPVSQQARDRRLSILWNRLKSETRQPAAPGGSERREALVPHLIATATSDTHSGEEFRKFQENLKSLGINSATDQIFRILSQSLPGWAVSNLGADTAKSRNPAIEAMSQIIHLAENPGESGKRFQEMVQAAIEQCNTGSLARAATMFDLALRIASGGKLDPAMVAGVRKTAHRSLDQNRLRDLAKEPARHRLLRKVLSFFDEFTEKNLLETLRHETKRDRRRLLLGLLEIYGDSARKAAFERLRELLAVTDVALDWHFARNLVCILNGSFRGGDIPFEAEIDVASRLLNLSLPSPLVKEAAKYAGQLKCSRSEELLISMAEELENIVIKEAASGKEPSQKLSLLDRVLFTLAHYGTPKAHGFVVSHGMSGREELGDTAARLAYLSSQDLTGDPESLSQLIRFLKGKIPRKLLGVTIHKNDEQLVHAVKALSSTPAPVVRVVFKDIASQFPDARFGQAAGAALKEFEVSEKSRTAGGRMMKGDLDLFGLPDLLEHLNQMQGSGTLTLKDAKGNPAGTFSLLAGHIQSCSAGRLAGIEAAYQLLEKPIAGTFVFQGQKSSEGQEQAGGTKFPHLRAVLAEGMRRYDELERARAIVPDFSRLKRKGPEPTKGVEKEDAELFDLIWQKTANGTSPEECEAICPADSYRVRSMLARWVEEGILTVE